MAPASQGHLTSLTTCALCLSEPTCSGPTCRQTQRSTANCHFSLRESLIRAAKHVEGAGRDEHTFKKTRVKIYENLIGHLAAAGLDQLHFCQYFWRDEVPVQNTEMIASVIAENPAMDYQSWRNGNRKLVDAWYKRYSKRPKKIPKSTYRKPREVVSSLEDRCSSSQFGLATLPLEKVNTSSQNWDLASPAAELDHDPRFSTKYFEVREAKGAGLGAFAIKDIKKGEVVMTEKPLFLATDATFWEKYQGLTGEQRDTYRSLHAWSKAGVTWENIAQSIFWTNRFRTYSEPGETGIFVKSSRFNHQCHPHANCSYFFYKDKNLLVFTVLKDIREGEEITISYSDKPQDFPYQYGFTCNCPRCLEAGRR